MTNEVYTDLSTTLFAELEALQALVSKDVDENYEEYSRMLKLEAFLDDLAVQYCGDVY